MSLRRLVRTSHGDDGITLVVAMMVMGVVVTLSVLVIAVAISTAQSSGRDRQQTVAINAAEAGVDAAYASIQSSGTNLPCSWPDPANATATALVNATPDVATSQATINYFKADGTPVGRCPTAADVGVNAPVTAIVDGYGKTTNSTGDGRTVTRRMQALINIKPVYGNSLNKAIYAEGNLAIKNQATLTGSDGPNADVYANGSFTCANNQNYAGSVYLQGDATVQGSCTIVGDLWAKGSVSNASGTNGSVGGRVISRSSTISLPGNFSVNGSLLAAGAITWPGCSTAGKCLAHTTAPAPPVLPFPVLRGDAATLATWEANGYTVITDNNCSTIKGNIIGTYAQAGVKTLVRTSCAVNFSNDKDIPLREDLAIFADGGFSSSQRVRFGSSNGAPRTLHWVVPADAATRPCSSPGITTDNQFSFATEVTMLVYSPCDISFSNNAAYFGQIIGGGNVSINNQYTMQYRDVPVFGIDPASLPLLSYKIDVLYKRETR